MRRTEGEPHNLAAIEAAIPDLEVGRIFVERVIKENETSAAPTELVRTTPYVVTLIGASRGSPKIVVMGRHGPEIPFWGVHHFGEEN